MIGTIKNPAEKPNIVREVSNIISPGTYIEKYNNNTNNYLMSIYIEKIHNLNNLIVKDKCFRLL